jgi:hypothetical protein
MDEDEDEDEDEDAEQEKRKPAGKRGSQAKGGIIASERRGGPEQAWYGNQGKAEWAEATGPERVGGGSPGGSRGGRSEGRTAR